MEVNRTGHFGRAAENLFLTQSAVSARIKMLEDTLGVVLFERQRNNIRLTASGSRFLKYAGSIVDTWQRARQDAGLDENYATSLAIGSLVDLWEPVLLDWLGSLRRQHPEIAFHTSSAALDVLTGQLLNGQLDLALVFDNYFSVETQSRFIKRLKLVMVSSQPRQLQQAFDADYIMVDWGTAYARRHAQEFTDFGFASFFMSHGSLALQYILRQGGTAYLPQQWVEAYIKNGTLYQVSEAPLIEREIYAIWRTDNERLEVISRLLQILDN